MESNKILIALNQLIKQNEENSAALNNSLKEVITVMKKKEIEDKNNLYAFSMLSHSKINCYNMEELLNMAKFPGKVYTLFIVFLNGRSADVNFYSNPATPEFITIDIMGISYSASAQTINITKFTGNDYTYVRNELFKYITGSTHLRRHFHLPEDVPLRLLQ